MEKQFLNLHQYLGKSSKVTTFLIQMGGSTTKYPPWNWHTVAPNKMDGSKMSFPFLGSSNFHWGYMLVSGRAKKIWNWILPHHLVAIIFYVFTSPPFLLIRKRRYLPKFTASSDSSFLEHRPQENVSKTAMQCHPPKIESDESVAEPKIGPDCLKSNSPPDQSL